MLRLYLQLVQRRQRHSRVHLLVVGLPSVMRQQPGSPAEGTEGSVLEYLLSILFAVLLGVQGMRTS
jgi:hypothetical protein